MEKTAFLPHVKKAYPLVEHLPLWYNTLRARTTVPAQSYIEKAHFLWKFPGSATLAFNYEARTLS